MTATQRPHAILSEKFMDALAAAGIINVDDLIKRVVIDANYGDVLRLYVERWGDERLLSVVTTLDGIEISSSEQV